MQGIHKPEKLTLSTKSALALSKGLPHGLINDLH